jgi:ABC-type multidrug transport system permease subunit
MRAILNTAWKDLARARRDPVALIMWIAIPLILGILITAVFGGGNATPQGRLLLADEDGTFLSNMLAGAFSREPLSKMVLVEKVARQEGRARLDRGGASALLIIPKGFADAVFQNSPCRVQLFTNPAQRILPKIIEEVLTVVVDAEFYLQQVGGDQLKLFNQRVHQNREPSDADIALYSVGVRHVADSLRKYLDPPAIQLETTVAKEDDPGKNFAAVLYPAFLFMGILFMSSSMAVDIWKERNAGAIRRLSSTPSPLSAFLAGRLLFIVLIYGAFGLAGMSVMRWLGGVPVAHFFGAVAWLVLSGTTFYLLLLFVVMQAETQRGASVLVNMVVFPASMLGGSFFPFESMPPWMVRIGTKLPNGWAVVQFHAILNGLVDSRALAFAAAGLLLLGGLAFMLSLRRLKGSFAL